MSRILLADDSPHAQRMGERILREEGFEVVTVTDGQTALVRLADVDPDVVFADISLPGRSGYDLCREIKSNPRHRHVRVVLTAGMLEHFDDAQAIGSRADAVLKKPFEASAVLSTIRPLLDAAVSERPDPSSMPPVPSAVPVRIVGSDAPGAAVAAAAPVRTDIEAERVRAAVTLALDAAMPDMIDRITEKVLIALGR
jgi:CheY-like chemotaxis protein